MGDNDVSVESVEVALLSEIEQSSAMQMKDAYQQDSGEPVDEGCSIPPFQPADSPYGEGSAGPNARVYLTKLSSRTPPEEIEKILIKNPDRKTNPGNHDFYTLVLTLSIRLSDPSTTRFLNGTINLAFSRGMKILTYSPKAKGFITAIIENNGEAISLSPGLDFSSSVVSSPKNHMDPQESRFGIAVGPEEKIAGTYCKNSGYRLAIPAGVLLDYQGMLKNDHEMFWEIFPPMPGQDIERSGKEMLTVFSFIVQAPKNFPPQITAQIEGRVKGNLWGVILLKGSNVF